jgi:hypothetical protein
MAVPWVYQVQRTVHNGETCSWVEMRGWSRFYCRKATAPAACDDVFRSGAGRLCSEAFSIDAPTGSSSAGTRPSTRIAGLDYVTRSRKDLRSHHEALNARDSAVSAAASVGGGELLLSEVLAADSDESGFDWRAAHRALGVHDGPLRAVFTRAAVLTALALVCAIGVLLGFVVRCVAPKQAARTAWHVALAFAGAAFLAVAVVSFALAHPAAARVALESFPALDGLPAGAGALDAHGSCITGPCASFSGATTASASVAGGAAAAAAAAANAGAITTLAWGPAGWSIAAGCLVLNLVLAVWATRHGDPVPEMLLTATAAAATAHIGGAAYGGKAGRGRGGTAAPSTGTARGPVATWHRGFAAPAPSALSDGGGGGGGFSSSEVDDLDVVVGVKRRARTSGLAAEAITAAADEAAAAAAAVAGSAGDGAGAGGSTAARDAIVALAVGSALLAGDRGHASVVRGGLANS